jgi:polar amino acid transport system permease protein
VLLFIVLLAFPYEVVIGGVIISIPDWIKAAFGLSLPIMANISEVVRGAVNSVPSGQWEAAESLAYTRRQTLWQIILPQCFKRMIPPWMNWYAILTMATPLCSLLGVEELITLSRQAIEAENNHPELLLPFYSFALLIFFLYCYPIARMTIALEKRYAVKL